MARAKKTAGKKEEMTTKVVAEAARELLADLLIDSQVTVTQADDGAMAVNVATEESGLLIGYHGETLGSFQLILGLVVYRRLGKWVRVVVEVGDYRAKRAVQLESLAKTYADQAIASGQAVYLPYLPPGERRVVHMVLAERTDVTSESEGEGNQRRVVIKPKGA